ncbi:MAG: helix-turn-helix domain-containing protein, partial [Gammaproteobacteria bacterium]
DEVRLTSYEFQLLATLVKSPNRVFNRDQIMESITGRDWIPSDRSVDVLVGKIRKKIEEDPHNPSMIKTIRGTGYKFTARVKYS